MSTGAPHGGDMPDGAQFNFAQGRATQNIVQHGNLYVGGPPNYRVDEIRPSRPDVPPAARRAPSRLLAARYQVVDFTGREPELAELAAWRDDPELGLAVRLVHGPGGQGKTRLAAQFAQHCAELGWTVAQAAHRSYDTAPTASLNPVRLTNSTGLLLIVDYAERWPMSDLLALVQDPLLRAGVPTRMLLLSRPAGLWWDNLSYRLADRFDIPTAQTELTALADTVAARTAMFTAARDRFAALLDLPDAHQIPAPDRLGEDAFGLVLTVHMAALAAVDAYARSASPPSDPAALSAYLLSRERDHWQVMYDNDQRIRTPPQTMARAVFTATLTRPQPYPDGVTALRRAGIPAPEQVLDDHRLCYPPTDPATVCEPLYPDRLGEDFLALSTPGHNLTTHQPDPWAATALARLMTDTQDDGARHQSAYTPQAVTMLIETARRWPHIARCQLFPLLREHPDLALVASGTALTRLADLREVDLDVLEAIEALLPSKRHVDLDLAIAAITSRLTQHRLAVTTDPANRAQLQAILGYRLAHAGRWDEALAATTEAVQIYRRLAEANPTAYEATLARSLTNLGMTFSDVGRREDALATTTEAAQIYRRLAEVNPTAFEPTLAASLNNLGMMFSGVGRREEALAITTEAVQIRRRSAEINPAVFKPELAMSLTNLGLMLSDVGRREDALAATTEAAQIYRRLAEANPAAFEPDLAASLTNLGKIFSGVGRREDALATTTEAAQIYRRLAEANPAAFEPGLAMSLTNLGSIFSGVGRREDALAATTEAVQIRQRSAEINPAAFEPELAMSLTNLGIDLLDLGRRDDALNATTEATQIYRRLAGANPTAFEPDLAKSLTNLGGTLSRLGRREDALNATTEAVQIYQRLAEVNPTAFESDLAASLTNLGDDLSYLGRRDDAPALTAVAVQIYRRLAEANPTAFEPDLAKSLTNLGGTLSRLGRREDALNATTEAVEVYRRLAEMNPTTFKPELASSLNNLGMMLSNLERQDDALNATTEAVQIRRLLVEMNPTAFEPDLAAGLWAFARVRAAGQVELPVALNAARESVASYERLAEQLPQAFTADLRGALSTLAAVLHYLGRHEDVVEVRNRIEQFE